MLTFSEEDMQYYHKNFIKIVEIAHDLGLKVYIDPWDVCRIFAGEVYSNFINLYPETRQILQLGWSASGTCANNPKTIKFFYK